VLEGGVLAGKTSCRGLGRHSLFLNKTTTLQCHFANGLLIPKFFSDQFSFPLITMAYEPTYDAEITRKKEEPMIISNDGAPVPYHDVDVFGHEEGHQVGMTYVYRQVEC
jgi:hypothetical protein